MELFNRFWELNIKSNPETQTSFNYVIKQDEFGHSLRINFDIDATIDIRYYSGTIRIYNLDPDKRKNLVFNILGEKWGTGSSIKFVAGYKEKSGVIMDGVVLRGYTIKEPETGDFITVLQCGTSFKSDKVVTIQPAKVTNANLLTFVKNWLSIIIPEGGIVDENDRFIIKRAKSFNTNLSNAVTTFISSNTVNKTIGFSGAASKVLNEISAMFNLVFYYDNEGFNVTTPTLTPGAPELLISEDTGMLGSPIYTDTGAKVKSYLRADYRLFQSVHVKSAVLDKIVKITILNHNGDTHTNAWYSEFDTNNIGNIIA
jgi:hypothetical protein